MNKNPTSATLSVDESAALLGVSRWAIYEAVSRDEIQAIRVGRRIRIARQPLMERLGLAGSTQVESDGNSSRWSKSGAREVGSPDRSDR